MSRDDAGIRLDTLLARELSTIAGCDIARAAIRRLIMAGAVRVHGRPVRRPGLPLLDGAVVRAHVDTTRLVPAPPHDGFGPEHILFADADLLAIAKPAGLPTHAAADARRSDVVSLARQYLAARDRGVAPYVAVHQRLDRETSGVLLLAIAERANQGLARAFADRQVTKVYHAIVHAPRHRVPERWVVDAPLAPAGTGRSSRMVCDPRGQAARTEFHVLERWADFWLIDARPHTGRRHQVRAHLAQRGLPIAGDTRYGAPVDGAASIGVVYRLPATGDRRPPATGHLRQPATRVMLHCARLELRHPVDGRPLVIECPWPADFADLAARARRTMRRGRRS